MKAIIATAMLTVVALGITAHAQERPPIVVHLDPVMTDAPSLEEAVAQRDAAVVVRVVSVGRPRVIDAVAKARVDIPNLEPLPLVATAYRAQVLSILKPGTRVGDINSVLTIGHLGGDGQWGQRRVISKSPIPDLVAGKDYMVFLKYQESWRMLMFEPYDIFEIKDGLLTVNSFSAATSYGESLDGRNVEEARALIEAPNR